MIPLQPVGWRPYFRRQKTLIPTHLAHYFYQSWEDGLWDLVKHFHDVPGAVALVPEFFCGDVVKNMTAHGLQCHWYPVDRHFQTEPTVFKNYLQRYQPSVVIIFQAVGITNQLWARSDQWLDALPSDTLLIEDAVHRVVNPQDISLLTERHVVIDSLRKVVPLPGSNVYGSASGLQLKPRTSFEPRSWWYQLQVVGWWAVFQLSLLFESNRMAEWAMLRGYTVIGSHPSASPGWAIFKWASQYLDHERIAAVKAQQVRLYQELLAPLWASDSVFQIHFNQTDAGKLRAMPVGLTLAAADRILTQLRAQGLLVRLELNDWHWSRKQKVIYLPLGPHLKQQQIEAVAEILATAVYSSPRTKK